MTIDEKRNLHNIILMFIKDNKTSFINTSTKLEIRKSKKRRMNLNGTRSL